MKRAAWILILALLIFALAGCNLFFDKKLVSYSVTHTVSSVSVEIVAADEEGVIFTSSTTTPWDYEFELKYTDFPFRAFVYVENNGAESVDVEVYREDEFIDGTTVDPGQQGAVNTSVSYD